MRLQLRRILSSSIYLFTSLSTVLRDTHFSHSKCGLNAGMRGGGCAGRLLCRRAVLPGFCYSGVLLWVCGGYGVRVCPLVRVLYIGPVVIVDGWNAVAYVCGCWRAARSGWTLIRSVRCGEVLRWAGTGRGGGCRYGGSHGHSIGESEDVLW